MKTLYGVQLGNNLKITETSKIIEVNSITKRKVGYGLSNYVRYRDLDGIKLSRDILNKYSWAIEEIQDLGKGRFLIIPSKGTNVYEVKYFHQLQNILALHRIKIKWRN